MAASPVHRTTIAVTGASGFLGGALVRHLIARGCTVYAYGRRPANEVASDLRAHYASWDIEHGTLTDAPSVDAVVHCAGKVDDWGVTAEFERANVLGTRHVLETWTDARVVHVSTASVYDIANDDTLLHEDDFDPLDAAAITDMRTLSPYSGSKRRAEHEVASRASSWVVLRPHLIYGPNDTQLVPRLLARVRRGTLVIPGDGRTTRLAPVHVDNLIHAIDRALGTDVTGAFNIVDAVTPTVDEALRTLFTTVGADVTIKYVPRALAWNLARPIEAAWRLTRASSPPPMNRHVIAHIAWSQLLDTTRAEELLDYAPRLAFPDSFATISIGR